MKEKYMRLYPTSSLRNICMAGHTDTGKTSLICAMLYASGKHKRLTSPEEGNAPTDFDREEIARKFSIHMACAVVEWNQSKLNLIDTPGANAFTGEIIAGARACESMWIVVNSAKGIEMQTEVAFAIAATENLPVFFICNQIDQTGTDRGKQLLVQLGDKFSAKVQPVQLRRGADLIHVVAGKFQPHHQHRSQGDQCEEYRRLYSEIIEKVAESDDRLLETYLEQETLSEAEFLTGLANAIATRQIFPLVYTSATSGQGIPELLDNIESLAPSPVQRCRQFAESSPLAQAVKTYYGLRSIRASLLKIWAGPFTGDQEYYHRQSGNRERFGAMQLLDGRDLTVVPEAAAGDIVLAFRLKHTITGDTLAASSTATLLPALPFPEPSAFFAVAGSDSQDCQKILPALQKIMEEDPTVKLKRDRQTGELLLATMGRQHLDIIGARAKSLHHLEIVFFPAENCVSGNDNPVSNNPLPP